MQQDMSHQMMGYDRASTMFSPDGRLLQVEYAKKSVRIGTSVIGMALKDGILLVADKRVIDKLVVPYSVEKVYQVDDHIAAAASGIMSDARILVEKAQLLSQQHRVGYDEPIEMVSLVKELCNLKQAFTQYGGARPFGVSLLVAGVDPTPRVFLTDPTGIYWEYKAVAIGENEDEIRDLLNKQYKESMTINDGISLSISILKKVLGKEFSLDRIDGCFIKNEKRKFHRLSKEYIKKVSKQK